jgi:hypothetical protein
MSNLSYRFIDELLRFLDRSDALSISKLLKVKNERYLSVYFKEDAKRYLSDKLENSQNDIYIWTEVIEYYILARNCLYNEDLPNAYENLSKSFKSLVDLIKDAKGNWSLLRTGFTTFFCHSLILPSRTMIFGWANHRCTLSLLPKASKRIFFFRSQI